ncbi:MAG: MFS transporter [Erysipelotrichia bacterium]|nr:MFS transporter [Erysipelotrichia bacterium]
MFISVFIASLFFSFSAQMSNSLLSLYAKSTGATADRIGSLMSMFAITALIFRFIAGPAMNAYNRKKLLQMAMCFFATAYLGFSFSPQIASVTGIDVITVMKMFRLLQGIGNAFGNSCLLTIVSDCLPKDKFASGMGIYACANTIAQAVGPTLGVKLRDVFGYSNTYIITCCSMLFSMVLVGLVVKIPYREKGKFSLNLKNIVAQEAIVPAIITFFIGLGFTSINSFFLVYAEERGIVNASLYFTVYAISMLLTRPLIGKLSDKFGFVKIAIPSILCTALSLVLIGQATHLWQLLVIAVINAAGYGAAQPALQSLCMKSVPAERRGSASSTNYIAQDSSTIIGPTVCGYVASVAGYTPLMWQVMAVPIVLGAVCTFAFRQRIYEIESNFEKRS